MNKNSLQGKSVLVVGLARSGLACAQFLVRKGARVTVTDQRLREELSAEIAVLEPQGVRVETGGHSPAPFDDADLIVVSPGVSLRIAPLQRVMDQGKTVISEIELAGRFLTGRTVGITGTNGKTTTTTLVGEILRTAGFVVQVGGNIGVPLISLVDTSTPETVNVVELSSFQLEAVPSFRPAVAVFLNLTPDHLDRYASVEDYYRAKFNLFANQTIDDFAVLNFDEPRLHADHVSLRSQKYWFSSGQHQERGTFFDGRWFIFQGETGPAEFVVAAERIQLLGRHNLENISAAITACRLLKADSDRVAEGIAEFKGVEHRLEWVAEIRGIRFYNDSKATNVDATQRALEAFSGNLIVILGGRDKGADFSVLAPLLKQRVREVILLGEASAKIRTQLGNVLPLSQACDMADAVRLGFEHGRSGDTVLLAPACASFDMFRNYEHRGRVFKESVQELQAVVASGQ
ncbi:MAG: UDP-N-acetylmuramoyl-L-alanine--D-glutamate ligase [Acidobacteriota bacterium]